MSFSLGDLGKHGNGTWIESSEDYEKLGMETFIIKKKIETEHSTIQNVNQIPSWTKVARTECRGGRKVPTPTTFCSWLYIYSGWKTWPWQMRYAVEKMDYGKLALRYRTVDSWEHKGKFRLGNLAIAIFILIYSNISGYSLFRCRYV